MNLRRLPTLQQKKNGWYYIIYYEKWRENPYKWRALGTRDKREAKERFTRLSGAYMQGQYDPWGVQGRERPVLPLHGAVDEFYRLKGTTLKDRSLRSLREVLDPFKRVYGNEVLLRDIGPKEVLEYCQKEGLSAQTIQRRLVTMKSFFRWHEKMGEEIDNRILQLEGPRVPRKPPRFMSREERDVIDKSVKYTDPFMWAVWTLGYSTGLRPVDLCRLKWEHIKDDRIEVVQSKYDGYTVPRFYTADLALDDLARPISNEWVLGSFRRPDNLSSRFGEIVKQLPIPPITLYEATRHTFASWLVQGGVSILQVSKWMGHKDVSTTMRYAHLNPDDVPPQAYEVFR